MSGCASISASSLNPPLTPSEEVVVVQSQVKVNDKKLIWPKDEWMTFFLVAVLWRNAESLDDLIEVWLDDLIEFQSIADHWLENNYDRVEADGWVDLLPIDRLPIAEKSGRNYSLWEDARVEGLGISRQLPADDKISNFFVYIEKNDEDEKDYPRVLKMIDDPSKKFDGDARENEDGDYFLLVVVVLVQIVTSAYADNKDFPPWSAFDRMDMGLAPTASDMVVLGESHR